MLQRSGGCSGRMSRKKTRVLGRRARRAIDRTRPRPRPLPAGEGGGLRSSGERRCGRDSCSCDIGRTRPHPGPLPAGEGEDCVPAVSGVAVAILARAISVALALSPLPAGEGEDCVPAVSGVAVAILARAISVALALTPALYRRERGIQTGSMRLPSNSYSPLSGS